VEQKEALRPLWQMLPAIDPSAERLRRMVSVDALSSVSSCSFCASLVCRANSVFLLGRRVLKSHYVLLRLLFLCAQNGMVLTDAPSSQLIQHSDRQARFKLCSLLFLSTLRCCLFLACSPSIVLLLPFVLLLPLPLAHIRCLP
jgi:hypothetical protein